MKNSLTSINIAYVFSAIAKLISYEEAIKSNKSQ